MRERNDGRYTPWPSSSAAVLALAAGMVGRAQVIAGQAVDESGAPQYRVDPFWPKPLPNRWSMQQVTGISVDSMDHVWFLNRGNAPEQDEIGGDGTPAPHALLRSRSRADRAGSARQRAELRGAVPGHPSGRPGCRR